MSEEKEQSIVKMYKEGKTFIEIKNTLQTSAHSIYRVLERNGIETDSKRNTWAGKTHSEETKEKMSKARKEYWGFDEEKEREIVQAYQDGRSIGEIEKKFEVNATTIYRFLDERKIPRKLG